MSADETRHLRLVDPPDRGLAVSPVDFPLIPRTLKAALAEQPLPEGLRFAAGLPPGASVADLRSEELGRTPGTSRERIRREFCRLALRASRDARDARILDRPWPARLDPRVVDWPVQVRKSLLHAGLIDDRRWISEATYGQLLAVDGLGIRSVFDLAAAAESAVDRLYHGVDVPSRLARLARRTLNSEWATRVSGADPRFRDVLGSDERVVAARLQLALEAAPDRPEDWLGLAWTLPTVVERVRRIDDLPLDVALSEYIEKLHGLDGPSCRAVIGRLGLDGRPPRTLTEAAREAGCSAERLRQFVARLTARLPAHPVHIPALDRAIELLDAAAPCQADDCAPLLVERGVAAVPFHPASVLSAADLCGRTVAFRLEPGLGGMCVVPERSPTYATDLLRLALADGSRFGVASLTQLTQTLRLGGFDVPEDGAREFLHYQGDAQFLDDDWFWFPKRSQGNRLASLARRMLAVVEPLGVQTIRAGIARCEPYRTEIHLPPEGVLATFYGVRSDFRVDRRGRVRHVVSELGQDCLPAIDGILVDIFNGVAGGSLDRATLREACLSRGVNRHTFDALMSRSPLLFSPERNRWCLRGTQLESVRARAVGWVG